MYSDTTNNGHLAGARIEDTAPAKPGNALEDGRAKLAKAVALAAQMAFKAKYFEEFLPALRTAARAQLEAAIAAYRAGLIYAEFAAAGVDVPAPKSLMMVREDLLELAAALQAAKLIDPHDVILTRLPTG